MKKTAIQGLVLIGLFFATLLLLLQVDWVKLFKIESTKDKTVQKLGNLVWDYIEKTERTTQDSYLLMAIDSIKTKICHFNSIDPTTIQLHVIEKNEFNAFALPGGHLVLYTGLITTAESPEALSGVIAHEIAHLEQHHVMKKLIKEVGISAITSLTSGGSGTIIVKEMAKKLSSTSFDRSFEKEADLKATEYLIKAHINPEPFAHFLYQHADTAQSVSKYLSWISTHPDSKDRAKYILDYCKNKEVEEELVIAPQTWNNLKENIVK